MGYSVKIVDGYCVEDPVNLHAGIYTVTVTDAFGCSTTAQYTVGETNSSITLSADVTDASCAGADGAIDLSISGGTGPYTVCWDTLNTANGAMFGITVDNKTPAHPYFGLGSSLAFYTDGVEAKELTLTKGIEYSFNISTPGHPWHISTDPVGGNSSGLVINGQTSAPIDFGTVFFTADNSHPSLLYYDCAVHQYMGYNIHISDGYCIEDLSDLPGGTYTVIVTDANGCSNTAQYTVGQTTSLILSANITNETCPGANDGAIDLTITGADPFTVCWDTSNTANGPMFGITSGGKTAGNPYFGMGSGLTYYTDGIEAKELSLVRGITYDFNVMSFNHPWHISTDPAGGNADNIVSIGQSGAPTDNGPVTFTPGIDHPSLLYYVCSAHEYMGYNINISDGYCIEDLTNLPAGIYTVTVTDVNRCTVTSQFTVGNFGCLPTLQLKVLIEGFYMGNATMAPTVDPVNYPSVCDTIIVELHDPNSPYNVLYSVTGTIDTDGNGNFSFPVEVLSNSYYVVVRHRNSIETWSKDPVEFSAAVTVLDLTTP